MNAQERLRFQTVANELCRWRGVCLGTVSTPPERTRFQTAKTPTLTVSEGETHNSRRTGGLCPIAGGLEQRCVKASRCSGPGPRTSDVVWLRRELCTF